MALPRFRIPTTAVHDTVIHLDDPGEIHHAVRVLRLKAGDACVVFDGTGTEYYGRIARVTDRQVTVAIERSEHVTGAPRPLTLVQALVKAPAFETILRHATELGVTRLVPVATDRSVVRVSAADGPRKCARWQRLLVEAAKQCQRADVPELLPPLTWRAYIRQSPDHGLHLMPTLALPATPLADVIGTALAGAVTLCIGPEGDFTRDEAHAFVQRGGQLVSLGPRILRTDTAALSALAIVQYEWSRQHP